MIIEKKQLDKYGKLTLSFKGAKEVFMAKKDKVVILSTEKDSIDNILKKLNDNEIERKKQALEEWFELIEKAGLDTISTEELDKIITRSILKEVQR